MELADHIGISLAAISISLTILEVFVVLIFAALAYFGYTEIRAIKRRTREIVQDEIKDFMESKSGRKLMGTIAMDEKEKPK